MEQLGTGWQPFADFLRSRRPSLKRGYLRDFHPYVLDLCAAGKGELLMSRRIAFGGLYHEAYSILAWRPKA
jgi:hypothetical protein